MKVMNLNAVNGNLKNVSRKNCKENKVSVENV